MGKTTKNKYPMVKLKEFNLSQINKVTPFTCLVAAPRNCGKSLLLRAILDSQKRRFKYGIVASQTEGQTHFFADFCPKALIKTKYKPEYSQELWERGDQLKKKGVPKSKMQTVLLADDCITDFKRNDEYMKKLFFNGRHPVVSSILTTQYPATIPSDWRGSIEYLFIGPVRGKQAQECIYNMVCDVFPDKQTFFKYLTKYTKRYKFLLVRMLVNPTGGTIPMTSDSDDSDDSVVITNKRIREDVFWFRADPTLKTKCFPDCYRTQDEIEKHYKHIGKPLHYKNGVYKVLENNIWTNVIWKPRN